MNFPPADPLGPTTVSYQRDGCSPPRKIEVKGSCSGDQNTRKGFRGADVEWREVHVLCEEGGADESGLRIKCWPLAFARLLSMHYKCEHYKYWKP